MSPLRPDDIRSKTFPIVMRGYDKEQVDAFIEELAAEYKELQRTRPATPPDPVESLGAEVTEVLRSARDAAESLQKRSQAEAEQIRKRAADKALEVRRKSQEEAERLVSSATAESKKKLADAEERASRAIKAAEDQASKIREETARDVSRIRDKARKEASDLLDDATTKHQRLVKHEEELRNKVGSAQEALQALKRALDDADDAAASANEVTELPGTGKSDKRVWNQKEIVSSDPKPVPATPSN